MITNEANAISTAFLRIDLLPVSIQPNVKQMFREYLDKRLETYNKVPDMKAVMSCYAESQLMQLKIWNKAVESCNSETSSSDACKLLLPALNEMFDLTTTRLSMTESHPPAVIFFLLAAMSIISALLGGFSLSLSKKRKLMHMIVFAAIMSLTVYVILDLEYPRTGLIKINSADHVLIDLKTNMN